jgi:segregation and condensation protein A
VNATEPRHHAVQTEPYDGPLELLLYLVRREGMDIKEISIAPLADAFLEQVKLMEGLDLDLASEFLVMSATLCWLKSKELLPSPAILELEDDDPELVREDLIRRLLEYERYKDAADELESRPLLGRDTFTTIHDPVARHEEAVTPGVDSLGLLEIFYQVLQNHAKPAPIHQIEMEHYSLEEMAGWILQRLDEGTQELFQLLQNFDRRIDRVIAFLAALEMAKMGMLDIEQPHHLAPISLTGRLQPEEADLSILMGSA